MPLYCQPHSRTRFASCRTQSTTFKQRLPSCTRCMVIRTSNSPPRERWTTTKDSLLPVTVQAAWKDQADTYYLFHEKIWKQNVLNAQSINEGGFSRKDICHPKSCTLARNRSSSKSGQLARVTRQASQECSACNWEQKSLSSSFFGKAEQARKRYTRYAWIHVLRRYVHCALTNTGEIFIALAGLASRVNDTLKDVYLAGLWRSVIFADLLCKGRHEHCG